MKNEHWLSLSLRYWTILLNVCVRIQTSLTRDKIEKSETLEEHNFCRQFCSFLQERIKPTHYLQCKKINKIYILNYVFQFLCLPLLEISSLMGYQCYIFFVANIVHNIHNTLTLKISKPMLYLKNSKRIIKNHFATFLAFYFLQLPDICVEILDFILHSASIYLYRQYLWLLSLGNSLNTFAVWVTFQKNQHMIGFSF